MENSVIIYTSLSIYDYLEFYYADKKIEPKTICQFPNIGASTNYIRAYSVPYGTLVKCAVITSGYIFNIYPIGFTLAPIFSSSTANMEFIALRDIVIRLTEPQQKQDQNAPT